MTALRPRKKLIEVSIPLEAINKASAKEKSIRYGHPSTLHLWWARRPLAACRAVLFAQLVDDPSAWPDRFPTEAAVETERARLHKVIERFVPWEASNDDVILQEARHEIARSVAWGLDEEPPLAEDAAATLRYLQEKAPPVYDPFSGGGSIPLEAQRLGLRAHGSDLNPVAVLIGKALVEIPPRFAGQPPVNPAARAALPAGGWRGAAGLAEDVRHYGVWMREEAARRIGHLYPKARLPDGGEARVIAWLWARTVRSPDPAAKGAMVPLVSSFLLSTKSGKQSWVKTILDHTAKDGYFFEVQKGLLSKLEEDILKKGTKSTKGGAFTCALTGATIVRDYIQAEGKADRLGQRLMAVVAEGARNRIYLAPDSQHEAVAASVENDPTALEARDTFLSPSTPTRAMITGGVCSAYGFRTWGHLFTPRQLPPFLTLSDLVAEVREKVLADAQTAELAPNSTPLHAGGTGATAYADAIATYLGLALDRAVMSGNSLVRWNNVGEKAQHAFGRQAFGMVWDFAEPNFFADSTGSLSSCYEMAANAMLSSNATYGTITCFAAQKYNSELPPSVISTDPPYYDNVAYSELSAFFYPWLKRCISQVWPSEFRRLGVPKDDELVVAPFRHDSREKAEKFFIEGMRDAIVAMKQTTAGDAPIVVYYAFKQSGDEDGATSAGWSSFLQAVIHSGLSVDGTWPLRTEMATRMVGQGANALASSIVLVCRKQATATHVATRAEFIRALRRQLPDAIDDIRKAGVGPVDMQQSIIGPGMGIFTNYSKVLEDDDSIMNVKSALALINRVWGEIANESDASYDAVTQVALAWFATYGFDARPSGELITLANAKDVPLATLFACGVFQDLRGKAGLIARADLPFGWTPAIDKTPTVWECVQHAIRVLNANDGGGEAAAALVAAMGSLAEPARTLAYRLFQIATERGWAAEALAYNALAEEWPRLEAMAPAVTERRPTAAAQASLF